MMLIDAFKKHINVQYLLIQMENPNGKEKKSQFN